MAELRLGVKLVDDLAGIARVLELDSAVRAGRSAWYWVAAEFHSYGFPRQKLSRISGFFAFCEKKRKFSGI